MLYYFIGISSEKKTKTMLWCDQEKQSNWQLVKIMLDIDQASMKAFTQFHDKIWILNIIYVKSQAPKQVYPVKWLVYIVK